MSWLKIALYGFGGAFEIVGIFLVAAPDLAPWVRAGRRELRRSWGRFRSDLRVLFRRPRHVTAGASAGAIAVVGVNARGIVGIAAGATIEEEVAYLLRRDEETQNRIADLHEAITAARAEGDRKLDEVRAALEARLAAEIRRALDLYRGQRLAGIGLLVLGAIMLSAGNFVS